MRIELVDIHKHFGPVRANDGVSLTLEPGTIHGLLGENGAGRRYQQGVCRMTMERKGHLGAGKELSCEPRPLP